MFSDNARNAFESTLAEIAEAGLRKDERIITSPQGADIEVGEHVAVAS